MDKHIEQGCYMYIALGNFKLFKPDFTNNDKKKIIKAYLNTFKNSQRMPFIVMSIFYASQMILINYA